MRKSRRIAALALTAVVMGSVAGGAAQAQTGTGATYSASAEAEALTITIFGETLTTSGAIAAIDQTPSASGAATQAITPLIEGAAEASHSGGDGSVVDEADCPSEALTEVPGIVLLDIACPKAEATIAGGSPSAEALGAQVALGVSVSQVLDTLQVGDPVREGVDQLWEEAINPIVENLTGNPVGDLVEDTTTTLHELLQGILGLETTARVLIAPVLAQASGDAGSDTADAYARAIAVRVELLPVDAGGPYDGLLPADLRPGEPLIALNIASASATSSWDGGTATHESDAAVVTLEIGTVALLEPLGLSETEITLSIPGERICLLEDTPLETCIALANAGTDADGAFAEGATVELFKGIEGGITLVTGTVRTTAGGSPAELARAPEPVAELPRTGGAVLPLLGLGMLGLAVVGRRIGLGTRES